MMISNYVRSLIVSFESNYSVEYHDGIKKTTEKRLIFFNGRSPTAFFACEIGGNLSSIFTNDA